MQVEKFYKAQELRKEIKELQAAIDSPPELKLFEKLNIETQKIIKGKVEDVIKKELAKIVKQKEKEFIEL